MRDRDSDVDLHFSRLYEEVKRVAGRLLRGESRRDWEATPLAHEAYLRMLQMEPSMYWASPEKFLGSAAEVMRRILVESARKRIRREKVRKSDPLLHRVVHSEDAAMNILELNELIESFPSADSKAVDFIKLRCFAQLTVTEASAALSMSRATGYRIWSELESRLQSHVMCLLEEDS